MAIDFIGALTGEDFVLTISMILFIIYFLWIYAWAKKQIGAGLGLILVVVITFSLFYNFPDLIWVPLLLFIWSVFGKELLERAPKTK